jgi:hypothetical protein
MADASKHPVHSALIDATATTIGVICGVRVYVCVCVACVACVCVFACSCIYTHTYTHTHTQQYSQLAL